MNKVEQLTARAGELGYQLVQGPTRFSGYVLIGADGEKPIGDDYRASLKDVENYLTAAATDAGVDLDGIEISNQEAPRPSAAALHNAVKSQPNAADIIAAMAEKPAPLTLAERRIMRSADHLVRSVVTPQQQAAFDKMSDADKQLYYERLRAVSRDVDAIEAKRAPQLAKPSMPLRASGINPDHPLAIERARQAKAFAEANDRLYRTNIRSRLDVDPQDIEDGFCVKPELFDERERDSLPPPDDHDPAPTPAANFTVTTRHRVLSKEQRRRRRLIEAVRTFYEEPPTPRRNARLGAALLEAKAALGADFLTAIPMSRAAAYSFMATVAKSAA